MDIKIAVALIAGSITALGWVANHILSSRREAKRVEVQEKLDFTKEQLEKLYGPLAFVILEGRRTWSDLLTVLGRDIVFEGSNELPEHEQQTWKFWVDYEFLPRNRKIRDLLESNTHLIEGESIPKSYSDFIEHESSWRLRYARWEKEGGEYPWTSSTNWPNHFEKDVLNTFRVLKARQHKLSGFVTKGAQHLYGLPLSRKNFTLGSEG